MKFTQQRIQLTLISKDILGLIDMMSNHFKQSNQEFIYIVKNNRYNVPNELTLNLEALQVFLNDYGFQTKTIDNPLNPLEFLSGTLNVTTSSFETNISWSVDVIDGVLTEFIQMDRGLIYSPSRYTSYHH